MLFERFCRIDLETGEVLAQGLPAVAAWLMAWFWVGLDAFMSLVFGSPSWYDEHPEDWPTVRRL